MQDKVSIIISAYNEERTISSVIEICRLWKSTGEIIVVNDGSEDKTMNAVKQFGDTIKVISYSHNKGKGHAMSQGIKTVKNNLILFMDADVVGLTHRDLDLILRPMQNGKADMVLGLARFWSAGKFEPFNDITGQRIVKREIVLPVANKISQVGYGVELFLNDLHKDLKVVRVKLPFVFILSKMEKQNLPDAAISYIKESKELLTEIVRQQAGEITPPVKKVIKQISEYLKQTLEYLK